MESQILVSFLVTVYNGQKHISNTIKSILNQSYKNIEIIIVNDGSTDATMKILQSFTFEDKRIKIFSPGRIGRAKALNLGLSKCNGKYVAINDADDYSNHCRVSKQVDFMERHPEIGLLGSSKEIHEEDGSICVDRVPTDDKDIRRYFLEGQPIQHSSVMFRKEIIDKVGGYNENIPFLLDRDIFLRVGKVSNMHQLQEPLIILNRSPNQYFRNKYTGIKRLKLGTYYQLKAVNDFGFSPLRKLPIFAKFIWGIMLELKKKL